MRWIDKLFLTYPLCGNRQVVLAIYAEVESGDNQGFQVVTDARLYDARYAVKFQTRSPIRLP